MSIMKWITVVASMLAVMACGQQETTPSATEDVKSSAAELKRESEELLGAIRDFTMEQKELLQQKVRQQLSTFNDKINRLQVQAENAGDEAKSQWDTLSVDMKEKLEVAEKHAEHLKDASADKWDDVKANLSAAMQDIEDAYHRAVARLK